MRAETLETPASPVRTALAERKRVSVLGATGSVGASTLDLIGRAPGAFEVVALTAHGNVDGLAELALRHRAKLAVVADAGRYGALKQRLQGSGIAVAAGPNGLIEAALLPADCVMAAIVGAAGLHPTMAAVTQGRRVALANKECLVSAGEIFLEAVSHSGAELVPVDSEHSAVFQAIAGADPADIERIVLTASGGPFRTFSLEQLQRVTPEQALRHPNWSMGRKITVDSATLMNKGLELIEAYHLFARRSGPARGRRAPPIDRPCARCLLRWGDAGAAVEPGHAHADRPEPRLAAAHADPDQAHGSGGTRATDLRTPR